MKYTISYWKHKDDEVVDVEREVEANSFDDAYREFRDSNPFVKIRKFVWRCLGVWKCLCVWRC